MGVPAYSRKYPYNLTDRKGLRTQLQRSGRNDGSGGRHKSGGASVRQLQCIPCKTISNTCGTKDTTQKRDIAGDLCERIVSAAMSVSIVGLRSKSRNVADVAFARQIAMYLMNTKLGYPPSEVAMYFERHISTVTHGCGLVEDKRDYVEFDIKLTTIENLFDKIEDVQSYLSDVEGWTDPFDIGPASPVAASFDS